MCVSGPHADFRPRPCGGIGPRAAWLLACLLALPATGLAQSPPAEPSLIIEGENTGRVDSSLIPPLPADELGEDALELDALDDEIVFAPLRTLRVDTNISPGDRPKDVSAKHFSHGVVIDATSARGFIEAPPCMPAAKFYHRPLYFEDVALEYHGETHGCLQPLVSAAKFYGTIPMLPYKMVMEPPHSAVSSQRYCYGYTGQEWMQVRCDAYAVEVGAVIGLILLIP